LRQTLLHVENDIKRRASGIKPYNLIHLSKPDRALRGNIRLDGSKSISNRALIALALAGADPAAYLTRLSGARDTQTLLHLLQSATQGADHFDAGDAGTTFRFLTAYLAMRPGVKTLTGSERMKQRPVGPLVAALRGLGADIQFLEKDGYPPLRIGEWSPDGTATPEVHIQADTSSQFLSALLLIAPYMPQGLRLVPQGRLVSKPYLDMTIGLMRHLGASVHWDEAGIHVAAGAYTPRPLEVEADWSAASYWYSMAALSEDLDLHLEGLFEESWQGDAVLPRLMERLGVQSDFTENGVYLRKNGQNPRPILEWDFLECPDIAQTLAVTCAGLGTQGLFTGLETLFIKETDRVKALKTELAKVGVAFSKLPPHFSKKHPGQTYYLCDGKAVWSADTVPVFDTYDDHRMAMSFAPLAMVAPVRIAHEEVVAKSYPAFWTHLEALGFGVDHIDSLVKT
jgi:3-phosphoshikimate 1-carboxyvinyltransferase